MTIPIKESKILRLDLRKQQKVPKHLQSDIESWKVK